MLHSFQALLAPALVDRAVLMANHVLAAEPVATERLRGHIGRAISVQWIGWPAMLPAPPVILFQITPAGLIETVPERGADETPDLTIGIDAGRPLELLGQLAAGRRVPMEIQGNAAFAADVNWLVDNVKWDIEADLARVIDPRLAHELASFAKAVAKGLRAAVTTGAGWAAQWRSSRS
jgi:ubiquinone biosynthesis protein UbiJ